MTVYLGSRCTIMLNSYDVIKEAFVKHGNVLSGRPQDLFFIQEITEGFGKQYFNTKTLHSYATLIFNSHLRHDLEFDGN